MTRRDRPEMPDGYGVPETSEGLLEWPAIETRLVASAQYWMATVRPDGRPHVVPRWGAWVDGRLWYDGSPETLHARNVTANPACTMHLEDGWQAVIVDGTSAPSAPLTGGLAATIAEQFRSKYADRGYEPADDAWSGDDAGGMMVFTPAKALAWFDFPNDMTRFRF